MQLSAAQIGTQTKCRNFVWYVQTVNLRQLKHYLALFNASRALDRRTSGRPVWSPQGHGGYSRHRCDPIRARRRNLDGAGVVYCPLLHRCVPNFVICRGFMRHPTGVLGGTFVPCQAWTSAFFDKRVVGRANAVAGGWGNSGGGFTFIIMLAVYNSLLRDGLSKHVAWRGTCAYF